MCSMLGRKLQDTLVALLSGKGKVRNRKTKSYGFFRDIIANAILMIDKVKKRKREAA